MFIFDAGVLAAEIRLLDSEIDTFAFFHPSGAAGLLSPRTWRRARAALDALSTGRIAYLQDGYA